MASERGVVYRAKHMFVELIRVVNVSLESRGKYKMSAEKNGWYFYLSYGREKYEFA